MNVRRAHNESAKGGTAEVYVKKNDLNYKWKPQ